jgi:hypothetical protein
MALRNNVFISYCHHDNAWLQRPKPLFKPASAPAPIIGFGHDLNDPKHVMKMIGWTRAKQRQKRQFHANDPWDCQRCELPLVR